MSSALRKIKRQPENLHIIAMNRTLARKAKVFLYKGNTRDHAICQFHIRVVGIELAKKLDTKIMGDMGTKAELDRIGKTELQCEVCAFDALKFI